MKTVLAGGRDVATRAAYWLACTGLTAYLLALHGQLPGLLRDSSQRYVELGKIECGESYVEVLTTGSCPGVGLPVGAPLGNGAPITILEVLVARLPGVTAVGALTAVAVALMAASVAGAIAFFMRTGSGRWLSLALTAAYLGSLALLGLVNFGSTFWSIAALPATLWVWLVAFSAIERAGWAPRAAIAVGLVLLTATMIMTDGYGAMFALAALGVLATVHLIGKKSRRTGLIELGALAFASIGGYLMFRAAPGSKSGWVTSDVALFRSMGADLVTFFVPGSQSWWGNMLGWAPPADLWGDGTNVAYNFIGFALVASSIVGAVFAIKARHASAVWLAVGLVAFMLALGPSLKVAAVRGPLEPPITYQSYLMPRADATLDLPSAFAYKYVPGMSMLRATYRWHALGRLSALVLAGYALSRLAEREPRRRAIAASAIVATLIVVEASPNPLDVISGNADHAQTFDAFTRDVATPLSAVISAGDRVILAPGAVGANDYRAWYLAETGDYLTYNVGGDKALSYASSNWPEGVSELIRGQEGFADNAVLVLENGTADEVVIPFFDLRWDLDSWPTGAQWSEPGQAATEDALADGRLNVDVYEYFAVVTLASDAGETPAAS